VTTWQVRRQVAARQGRLTRVLQAAFLDPADPLGGEAARSLGRLVGLWQVFGLNRFAAGLEEGLEERLALLLREAAALTPMGRRALAFHLARAGGDHRLRRIPLGLEPPRGGALELAAVDPLTWALSFPAGGGGRKSPGPGRE
jgi:hypothetical protein